MEDPRIEELMEYFDSVDENGELTSIALIARRVSSYLEVIDELRDDLDENHSSVEGLEERASNLSLQLQERATLRDDISQMAQTTAMKAALSTSSGRGVQLRKAAAEKQQALAQFEVEHAKDEKRLKEAMRALEGRHVHLMEIRNQISRRMNIVDALLQRAEIEWPSYFFEENKRLKPKSQAGVLPVRRRRGRGGGRRRLIRRRKAS